MQILNDDQETRTVTLTQDELLTIAVLMKKGARAWQKDTGQAITSDLELANVFSSLHCELLRYQLVKEGKL